jgi:hypothetical protein
MKYLVLAGALAQSVSNNLAFFSSQQIGRVNSCMQARIEHPDAPYTILN